LNKIIKEDAQALANANLPWEKLNGKIVLISGANGYVPAYFVHALLARNDLYGEGINVVAICRNEEKAKERFGEYMGRGDFKLLVQDICEPIEVRGPLGYLIHAASPADIKTRNERPVETFRANVWGMENVLSLAREKQAEGVLLVSSVDVYGDTRAEERLTEDSGGYVDSLNPRNVYTIAKNAAEMLCSAYYAEYGTPAVIARLVQVMGPGIALHDKRLHIDFISQMLRGDEIVLKSDGSAKRSFLYITDAVAGMLFALLRGRPVEAYNVADERCEATVLELAELMSSIVADRKISIRFDYNSRNSPEVKQAVSWVTADSSKLRSLGWGAKFGLKETAERMMRFYGI